jgi:dihydrofolate synthase / folylpolyglutamate synthase
MTYSESLDWLYGLQVHGIKLGLDNVRRLCDALGVVTESGEERKFIHVAGTNGKGSVCAMAAAMLCASGKRTGLYTSPHLVSFRERIRLGRNLIPEDHVASGLCEIREVSKDWEHAPTFFEVTTVLALAWFQKQNAEWVVLETGLGGRLDATNVVTPRVSVITSIGLDHTKFLGDTLGAIAGEKAGIIKKGVPVVASPQEPEAEAVIREAAAKLGCSLKIADNPVAENCTMSLAGSHQRMNAAVAFATVVSAGLRPDPRAIYDALRVVEWPGRFQAIEDGRIILDGAHNPPAAERLASVWREVHGEEKPTLIFGAMSDKDIGRVLKALAPLASRILCVRVANPRAEAPEVLAETARIHAPGVEIATHDSLADALACAVGESRVLIAGSLFLIGEALAHFKLAEPDGRTTVQ